MIIATILQKFTVQEDFHQNKTRKLFTTGNLGQASAENMGQIRNFAITVKYF